MVKPYSFTYGICSFLVLSSCDDVVSVKTKTSDPVLNIDAWINNKSEVQTITLAFTQDYFDNENLPSPASGATVLLTNQLGQEFLFIEDIQAHNGSYRWTPQTGETLGTTGDSFTLSVLYSGETFVATSAMGRVPMVQDISFEKMDIENPRNDQTYYRAEFWADDPEGKGDTYWIKTYKNGTLLNKASEINIAYDAAQSEGSNVDGVTFIGPIRQGINANDEDDDGFPVSPLNTSDSVYVEIHAITYASFNYLNEVITQTDRSGGLSELFMSTPLANVSTNIVNLDGNGSAVVGFFNVSTVSGYGERFNLK